MTEQNFTLAAKVYIVGAGPGDPDLLTVKAQKILEKADAIFYADSLVPKQILAGVKASAELIPTANQTLENIVPMMIARVRDGKSVVRLHSGDPSLYSAIHEQIEILRAANIDLEVIPGISAYQDAAAKLQVELTLPGLVQTIILTRTSGEATSVPEPEQLASLAAHKASLCLYLSARHIESAQAQLLAYYPADLPVAICYRLGWPDERILLAPLAEIAEVTERENLIRTTLYVISPALGEISPAMRSGLYNPGHHHLFRPRSATKDSAKY